MKEERPRYVYKVYHVNINFNWFLSYEFLNRSGIAAEQNANNPQKNNEMKNLRHAIVGTFQEQMKLRKKLMELDSHLLGLAMDAERQHLVISHWESRNNRLYNAPTTSRISTQQSYR